MDAVDAAAYFADKLKVDCPVCPALVGELCNSEGVWIHYERFVAVEALLNDKEAIFSERFETFSQLFLRFAPTAPPELRTAFVRMSLARAESQVVQEVPDGN